MPKTADGPESMVSRSSRRAPRPLRRLALAGPLSLALVGCNTILGGELDVVFEVEVVSVDTVTATTGVQYECSIVVVATATGEDGDRARFGESVWTFNSLADGAQLHLEVASAAFMAQRFGTDGVDTGSTARSSIIERPADAPFEWDFVFNYRKPSGLRETVTTTATCG